MPSRIRPEFAAAPARTLLLGLVAMLLAPLAAQAQFGPGPGGRAPYAQGGGKNVAGEFDYFALVLSWSPSYCAGLQRDGYDPQCHRRDGKRYSFVLHGLWPQYERGWPESCPTTDRPFVPQSTIDRMLDIMPSNRLVIHEYKKHGTCAGLGIDGYFDMARKLFQKVKVPARYANPNQALVVAPGEIARDFVEANPGLKTSMLGVACGGPGNRLKEIRFCFSKAGELRDCGRNEEQRRLCSSDRVMLPPVRATGPTATGQSPLPLPR